MIDQLIQKNEKKLFWLKRIPWITYGSLQIFITVMFWDLFLSSQENLKFYLLISFLILVGSLLGYFVTKSDTKRLQKAIALSKAKRPSLELTSNFLFIPTLMLMNPAFWRALDQDLSEIKISLEDIVSVKIFAARSKQIKVIVLKVQGHSQIYTRGGFGDTKLFDFGIKVLIDFSESKQKEIAEKLTQKSF